ncbi:PREDICTED: L-xylulose reductase-like, partial [Fulmarus glacialis]|uniref:L-xylulose reductase-like n=1 Tax=Fulmarus glacialis TaxID=30455 RepID=UPI00051AF70D
IKSIALAADVSKPEDVQRIVDTIVARWGTVHIACNNAGINMNSASEDTSLEEWDKTFNVNLRGLFLCCQAAGRIMLNQGYGKIINTASMASLIVPHPQKQLAYNTSKAGVVKLTQTLGTEWIERGVKVNCISPGIVDTPLIRSKDLRPLVRRWLADIPAGRLAQATDLQAAVVYLASEASDYMTGPNLVIEGGICAFEPLQQLSTVRVDLGLSARPVTVAVLCTPGPRQVLMEAAGVSVHSRSGTPAPQSPSHVTDPRQVSLRGLTRNLGTNL